MRRLNKNWLDSYMQFTSNTESLPIFNRWVGLSAISAALQKKVNMKLGRLDIFANMYVVLVADPGVARKSQAISYMTKIVSKTDGKVNVSSTASTVPAMLDTLEESIQYVQLAGGNVLRHASLSVVSKEFEVFFNTGANRLLPILTDMFDCEYEPWTFRTKSYGNVTLPAVYLSILAATTPVSLTTCLSDLTIGGGLTSRIIFVCADKKSQRIAFPSWSSDLQMLQISLQQDLTDIAGMVGTYEFSKGAKDFWEYWYVNYDDSQSTRIERNAKFDGWYSRKSLHILKTAMCVAASESADFVMRMRHLETAIKYVEEVELTMGNIFKTEEVKETKAEKLILEIVQKSQGITERQLLHSVWRDITREEFYDASRSLARRGLLSKRLEGVEVYYTTEQTEGI